MPGHDIVVVGASAGGVEALMNLLRPVPADLPAAILIVLHMPASGTSLLPQILTRATALPVVRMEHDEPLHSGRVYVAPPDRHLVLRPGLVHLSYGPKENGHRPAIDVLFRSAAATYRSRVTGVVLSGTLDDGTAGLAEIKRTGGVTIVQDPADALFTGMPRSALENVAIDFRLPASEIARVLDRLAHEQVEEKGAEAMARGEEEKENEAARLELDLRQDGLAPAMASGFTCPECGGALWELENGELFRYRCRVGHAYSAEVLVEQQSTALEAALWAALRALQEKAALMRRLALNARNRGRGLVAARFEEQAKEVEEQEEVIRHALEMNIGSQVESDSLEDRRRPG